jgi:SAM-dependent methyltransferase
VTTPSFPKRDPGEPDFWDLRYEARFAPWDAGRVPARLARFIASQAAPGERAPAKALVPGCGSGYEVRALAEARWDVLGIDFSAEALAAARPVLGPFADRVRQADFFAPLAEAPFDLVYERAFLCALPRRLWPAWAARMAEVVGDDGLLAGFFFIADGERGPPFPLHGQDELDALLAPAFECVENEPVADSIAVFAGRERWQAWRRRAR